MNEHAIAAIFFSAGALGHALIGIGLLNRLHSFRLSRHAIRRWNIAVLLLWAVLPCGIFYWWSRFGWALLELQDSPLTLLVHSLYLNYWAICIAAAAAAMALTAIRFAADRVSPDPPERRRQLDFTRHAPHPLLKIPGNQSLQVSIVDRELTLFSWPSELDGFRILHLSDLHFSDRLGRSFFEDVFTCCAGIEADLAAITGDLLEDHSCLEWVPTTLGRLRAPAGVYWIRGNHEIKIDADRLRALLGDCGLVYVGGRYCTVEHRGRRLLIAGNELPWFGPAPEIDSVPASDRNGMPQIALLHTPDQFAWAVREGFALALAGHVHGGQIRLPFVGPVLSPSRFGVKYARRSVYRAGATVMHVSRGLAAEWPLRIACRPEIVRLTLRLMPCTERP